MYLIDAYNTTDKNRITHFIAENSFADLVTYYDGSLCSNKVPFYYDGEKNMLFGHFGRNNPQLMDIEKADEVLVIFSGAHAYISPQWYESENGVPTWNFQTIQVRGNAAIVDDKTLVEILAKLTKFHESQLPKQWTMSNLNSEKRKTMFDMITGFKIEITDIKFKEKMSQMRDLDDQKSVIRALKKQNKSSSDAVSEIMNRNIESSKFTT